MGQGNGEHFRRVLAAPFTRNPDLSQRDLTATPIIEVTDKRVFNDGQREVRAYVIENPHADGLVIGYVADAQLGLRHRHLEPGAGALPDKLNPNLAALVAGVKKAGSPRPSSPAAMAASPTTRRSRPSRGNNATPRPSDDGRGTSPHAGEIACRRRS